MRCNCSHLCRLSSSWVRFANSAHFSACRRKNFTEAIFRTLQIPGFCIAPFLILRCNENYMASQQDFHWPGATWGSSWRRLGDDLAAAGGNLRDGTLGPPKDAKPQSLMCHRPVCRSPHISAPITPACGRRRSMSTRLSRSRQIPGIFCVDIWLQGDAANIANFPCSSALMSPM